MKPHILLRAAAVLTLIHAALHTFGGMLQTPSRGLQETVVLAAMKGYRFDAMGSTRSYWDFYMGFGFFLSVSLVLVAVLLWQLASIAKSDAARTRPMVLAIAIGFAAFTALSWRYFFVAPLVTEALIAALLAVAFFTSRTGPRPA